jgi:hypothetical protein
MKITLEDVYAKLEELTELIDPQASFHIHESKETDKINTALAKAQCEYPLILLNRKDTYMNNAYTDLDNIMREMRPILGKHGISITQRTLAPNSGKTFLQTRIWHNSGQWIQTIERFLPTQNNIDIYVSELNELKKSQVMALLNITIANDQFDDNGYEALKEAYKNIGVHGEGHKNTSMETITRDDLKKIEHELQYVPHYKEKILRHFKIRNLADIPLDGFQKTITGIRTERKAHKDI